MTKMPPSRPKITLEEAEADLAPFKIDPATYPIVVIGYRGYYRDTMGKPGVNDRGEYDDAICLIIRRKGTLFLRCNGNTDPSAREGSVTGRASLLPGFWPMWKLDMHKGRYLALCQRLAPCTVSRDNTGDYRLGAMHDTYGRCLGNGKWTGYFGINGHKGGINTTSSEGCQTIPPSQWDRFIDMIETGARSAWGSEWNKRAIPYVLLDKTGKH